MNTRWNRRMFQRTYKLRPSARVSAIMLRSRTEVAPTPQDVDRSSFNNNDDDIASQERRKHQEETYRQTRRAVYWLMTMLAIAGANYHRRKGKARYCAMFHSALGFALVWFSALRIIPAFTPDEEFGSEFFHKVCLFANSLSSAMCYSVIVFTSKHFYVLIEEWEAFTPYNAAISDYGRKLVYFVKFWTALIIVSFIASFVGVIVAAALGVIDEGILILIVYPFGSSGMSEGGKMALVFVFQLMSSTIVCCLMCMVAANTCLTYLVYGEFTHVARETSRLVQSVNQSEDGGLVPKRENDEMEKIRHR